MAVCDTYIDDINNAYEDGLFSLGLAQPHVTWLMNNYSSWSSFNLTMRTHLVLAIANLEDCCKYLLWGSRSLNTPARIPYYLRNCVGGDIDMDAILSAMVVADGGQLQYFIGIVDAYRQSIWNKPFNEEFFAALARGFEQWE